MRKSLRQSVVFLSVLSGVLSSGKAFATTGVLMWNLTNSFSGFVRIFDYFAYVSGILLCVISIMKFKDHVDNPANTPLSAGVKRFIAGGMLLCLPFMESVVQHTVYGGPVGATGADGGNSLSTTGFLDPDVVTPGGLDAMIVSFMSDIYWPFGFMLSCFTYLMAIGLLLIGINRLTKRMDEGPRGPAGIGTIMTFIVSGVLFAWADVAGVMLNSVFNGMSWMPMGESGEALGAVCVDADGSLGLGDCLTQGTDAYKIGNVIQALMFFVGFVGMIAFIRGWLVLRALADGQQGATLAQGLTFLAGGTLAINLGGLVNALQSSLGISGTGLTFY